MSHTSTTVPATASFSPIAAYRGLLRLADRIPLSLVQLATRAAAAHVFWNSSQAKLASWTTTEQLFRMEYHVPLIPPEIAAPLATATELTGSILLAFGLFARLGAAALLGVVAVIQLFVYPGNWAEHLMWAALLFLILARGAGAISLDKLASYYFSNRS